MKPLVILSHGLGQDSAAMLALYLNEPEFRAAYVGDADLIVVNADTGDEHPDTEAYEVWLREYCAKMGVQYYRVGAEYRTASWRGGLTEHYRSHKTIGMRTTRSCTDNLKIQPIYKWLDEEIGRRYGWKSGRKAALRAYSQIFGKLKVLIGFADGEQRRVGKAQSAGAKWMVDCVEKVYPLFDLGMDRSDCQDYVESVGLPVPMPSNCMRCHHKRPEEVLWTSLVHPDKFDEWVELEQSKLAHWAGRTPKNDGVYGAVLLPQVAAKARADLEAKLGTTDSTQLIRHLTKLRFTRGHCVTSGL